MNTEDDKKPKPPPGNWSEHIQRDLDWMINEHTIAHDRQRYAARIMNIVERLIEFGIPPKN